MAETFALFCISIAAIIGMACAIHYFWQCGPLKALGYAAFVVFVFLIFWASGLWVDASRHSWGPLTPVFAIIIVVSALAVGIALRLLTYYANKKHNK